MQFPLVEPGSGQDYWEIDVTLNGYGGVGNHYFLAEVPESAIASTGGSSTVTVTGADLQGDNTVKVPNAATLTSANVGWSVAGTYQWKYVRAVTTGAVGAGDMKTVVTAAGMTGSPKTITFPVGAAATAVDIATAMKTALDADVDVTAVFDVYRFSDRVFLKKKTGTDTTMNFTLEPAAVGPATNIATVTIATDATIASWVTAVGNNGSGGVGFKLVTLNNTFYQDVNEDLTFTRAASGYSRSYVFEWRDADLAGADLAPYRDYPPPAARFGGVLGDVIFVDGAFGDNVNLVVAPNATDAGGGIPAQTDPNTQPGNAIAISEPVRPESFPADNYLFTGDSPTALIEGSMGMYWRFAKNSLGVIRYIGGQPALSYEKLWTGIGIQNQNQATLGGGGRLYAYTGARGAVRLGVGGEPDTAFAAPVADDMATWTADNVVMGYDANYQYVLFAHNQTLLAYFEPMDVWCAPLNLTSSLGTKKVKSMVTLNSEVYIAAGDDPTIATPNPVISLYKFDAGTGTTGKLVTHWMMSDLESDILSRIRMGVRSDGVKNMIVRTYRNGQSTPSSDQLAPVESGIQIPTTLRSNVRNARMWKVEAILESAGGDAGWENIVVEGETSGITL